MLESEAMAILVGAGVSYGRREAALRAAGSALAILAEPGLYVAQLQEKGLALLRHALADEARLLGGLAKKKMALVLREDAQYPPLLRQIAHPPHLLYVYGETDLTDRFPVAVVGTRRASAYGLTHTREIAAELAQTGVCVVSGLALGIDAAAHTGALDGGGRTVAVLGSALVGLIPNCAASVVIAQLYVEGALGAGAMMAGLLVSAGVGLLVLFRTNRGLRQNLIVLAGLWATGAFWGLIISAFGIVF